ncbi:ERV25 [Candida pseudojiufengensis]|uniref:ERV25 n=1 Tax=Candida pseudojiufengensis TaxID=497109 RepID=UPI0022252542|nr:ERV25 [Candida pseudojiufengensis]KAI5965251.1 ERV25 [Candida pseudojiufengensis]
MQSLIFNYALILSFLLSLASSLHMEIPSLPNPEPVCIRDFVQENQMVTVNIYTDGSKGDGQRLDVKITDTLGNNYAVRKDIVGDVKLAFTSQDNAAIDVCFTNYLEAKWKHHGSRTNSLRTIELEIESGASARNWNALQASEKLKPNEVELKKIESLTEEIVSELQYLKSREERMRDTNESTNSRVKWFSIIIILSLIGFGVWQIQYLRYYFKVKHII